MLMQVNNMRKFLAERYSPKFAKRLDTMNDDQVIAIYYRVTRSKDFHTTQMSLDNQINEPKTVHEEQLSLF